MNFSVLAPAISRFRFAHLFILLPLAPLARAATLYVSPSGTGTVCSDINPCSLQEGYDQAAPGDTIIAKAGSYPSPGGGGNALTISGKSGAANAPITLRAENYAVTCADPASDPDGCVVSTTTGNRSIFPDNNGIVFSGGDCDYWIVEGFEMRGRSGIKLQGTSLTSGPNNNIFRYMYFTEVSARGGQGILVGCEYTTDNLMEHCYWFNPFNDSSGPDYGIRLIRGANGNTFNNLYFAGGFHYAIAVRNFAKNTTINRVVAEGMSNMGIRTGNPWDHGATSSPHPCNGVTLSDGTTGNVYDETVEGVFATNIFVRSAVDGNTQYNTRYGWNITNARGIRAENLFFANMNWPDNSAAGLKTELHETQPYGQCGLEPGDNIIRGMIVVNLQSGNRPCAHLASNGYDPSELTIENFVCHNANQGVLFSSKASVPGEETTLHPVTTIRNSIFHDVTTVLSGHSSSRLTYSHNNVYNGGTPPTEEGNNLTVDPEFAGSVLTVETPDIDLSVGQALWDWSGRYQPIINRFKTTNSALIDEGTGTDAPCESTCDIGANEFFGGPSGAVLAGHWELDEGSGTLASDVSGNDNDGTLQNGPTWTMGQLGSAISFDGDDDVVNCGSDSSLDNLPALSVAAWINAASLGENSKGRIVAKGTGIGPTAGWHFHVTGTNQLEFRVDHATTDLSRVSAANAISLGTWRHVAVVWDGSATSTGIKIYVDGVETSYASSQNGGGARVDDASSSLHIGNSSTGDRAFDGDLDDVRIYNGALSDGEILALVQASPPLPPSGLVATSVAYDQINLSWVDNASDETGFRIERKKGSGGIYAEIDTVGAGATSYNDETAGAGTTYYYRVLAYGSNGDSAYSNEASDTTDEVTGRQGHWKLDEGSGTTTADSSGNANTGTLANGPTWSAGQIESGLGFDGADDVVTCGSGTSLDNLVAQGGGGMTVAAWINADSMGENGKGRIVVKGSGISPTAGWHLHANGTNQLEFRVDHSTTDLSQVSATNSISTGAWRHVLVTWTGSTTATNAHIYVDGVETSYATTTNGAGSRVDDAASSLYLGNESGGSRAFDGLLDDVRVYNRVLSSDEITAVYRAGL